MTAAIVLHGLFLLACHPAGSPQAGYCHIYVPYTPMPGHTGDVHDYQVGVVGAGPSFPISWKSLDPQQDRTKPMSLGPELAGVMTDPFMETYNDGASYSNHQFMLNGDQLSVTTDPAGARNVMVVPWPDRIAGGNRVSVSSSAVVKDSERIYISSQADTADQYLFSETLVLYYNTGKSFTLRDGNTLIETSTNDGTTWIMVLSSWPPKGSDLADHSSGFDALLNHNGTNPTFQVTGIATVVDSGSEPEFYNLHLPASVTTRPTPARVTLLVPDERGEKRPTRGHWYIFTGTQTGCGVGSVNGH